MQNERYYLLSFMKIIQKLTFLVSWFLLSDWKLNKLAESSKVGLEQQNQVKNNRADVHNQEESGHPPDATDELKLHKLFLEVSWIVLHEIESSFILILNIWFPVLNFTDLLGGIMLINASIYLICWEQPVMMGFSYRLTLKKGTNYFIVAYCVG